MNLSNAFYSLYSYSKITIVIICFFQLLIEPSFAQPFQKTYGTSLDNSFSKVIPDGSEYYVLGQDQPNAGALSRATVTRLASDGTILWTRSLDIASQWNDAIRVKKGELILVGNSLPGDASSKSIMGRITTTGTFTWLKSYDDPGGRDFFLHIIENPAPQNPNYPYYIVGGQREVLGLSSTWDDVVLLNINDNGNINWKKVYTSDSDDEFLRDIIAFPNGNMVISGSRLNRQNDHSGIFYIIDNTGVQISGKIANWMSYPDITQAQLGGEFYMASNSVVGTSPFISKFDQNYNQIWQVQIPSLTSISQIWAPASGDIYATGIGTFGNLVRTIILKLKDNAPNTPSLIWARYLNIGNSFIGGSSWLMPTNEIIFTDGRITPTGFGGRCAFMSRSDLDLNTCNVSNDLVLFTPTTLAPINQVLFPITQVDTIAGVNIPNSFIDWREVDVCKTCCADSSTFANLINQGFNVVINNCKVIVTAPQFDSCYSFSTPPSLDGANVPQVITNPNGMWMYNFTQNGNHQVCVNVFDECNSKKMCTNFSVTKCDTCVCGGFDIKYGIGRGNPEPKNCGDILDVPASLALSPIRFLTSFSCLGTNCPQAVVQWHLQGPPGFITLSGSTVANPGFIIPINNTSFSIPGPYTLTMFGNCGSNKCQCVIYFNAQGHDCCASRFDFELGILNAVTVSTDNINCKASVTIGNLPQCDTIRYINWGDGNQTIGPISSGSMSMHNYTGSGTYIISLSIAEYNNNIIPPRLCFDTLIRDTITIVCAKDTCIYAPCANNVWQAMQNNTHIFDMVEYNGKLIIAGDFFNLNGINTIAAWDGNTWSALGTGVNGSVNVLEVHNGLLYVGGSFSSPGNNIAVWNGLVWNSVGVGTNGPVNALHSYNPSLIFIGGNFSQAGGIAANNIVYTNNIIWANLPDASGSNGVNGPVNAIENYLGSIAVGGLFSAAGGISANNIALWNGANTWLPFGNGITLFLGNIGQGVDAIQQLNNDLIVAGRFQDADLIPGTAFIAKYNGTNWTSMAGGVNTSFEGIYDLALFGGELYAGGLFTVIGGNPISGVARWNGTNWFTTGHQNQLVRALTTYHQPGKTCDLYSGGEVFLNHWECITSTDETLKDNMRIFPNPTDGVIMIDFQQTNNSIVNYKILDITSRCVIDMQIEEGAKIQTIDASALSSGLYFLQIMSNGKVVAIEKFIKQKQ